MPWSFDSDRTVYLQLMDQIKQRILSGEYKPGEKVPSVRDLAAEAAVNPNTMQRAFSELERTGFLYTQRTNGRFITEDIERINSARKELAESETDAFLQKMYRLGLHEDDILPLIEAHLRHDNSGIDNHLTNAQNIAQK